MVQENGPRTRVQCYQIRRVLKHPGDKVSYQKAQHFATFWAILK